MQVSKVIAVVATGLLLASCGTDRMDTVDTTMKPEPLEAQPVQTVESGQLPDPTTDTSQFPTKPENEVASNQQAADQLAAAALDVKKESMVGSWKVSANGANCQMFLTLTNLGSGSRGGTRGCAGDLTAMGSWEVNGKTVLFKNRNGDIIGRVYKSADTRFDGTTNSGQPISLSR